MEKQLVSFGNYLLKKCKVKGFNVDGEPSFNREVTDADLCNWKDQQGKQTYLDWVHDNVPSDFKIGEEVKVCLMPLGEESFPSVNAKVIAVHFTNSKVKYDLEINYYGDYSTRIYNVDSILLVDKD